MLGRYEECSTTGEATLKGYNALKGHSLRAETVKELVKEISSAPSTTLNAVTLGWALWEWEKKCSEYTPSQQGTDYFSKSGSISWAGTGAVRGETAKG